MNEHAIVKSSNFGAAEALKFLNENRDRMPAEFEMNVNMVEFFVTDNPRANETIFAQVLLALLKMDYELQITKHNERHSIQIKAALPPWKRRKNETREIKLKDIYERKN